MPAIEIIAVLLFFYALRVDVPNLGIIGVASLTLFIWGMVGIGRVQNNQSLSSVRKTVYSLWWGGVAYGSRITGGDLGLSYSYIIFMFIVYYLGVYAEWHEKRMAAFLKDIH